MYADNLYLCVAVTLAAVSGGTWLVKISGAIPDLFHRASIETLGIVLLFASWMPTTNAAWLTSMVCDLKIRQMMADAQEAADTQIATQIASEVPEVIEVVYRTGSAGQR